MSVKTGTSQEICPACGRSVTSLELQTCSMCRTLFCRYCAERGYGREFCSDRCRAMFFFGDGDEVPEKDE